MYVWIIFIVWAAYELLHYIMQVQQYKKARTKADEFQKSLKVGDPVILSSGVHGTIEELNPATAVIRIADHVAITVERFAITTTPDQLEKGTYAGK